MTTRHVKQCDRWQKRDLILEAVLKLNYWPTEWEIHVELCQRPDAQLWFRRRKKKTAGKMHLLLRLREDWLEHEYHPGRAVIDGHFILYHALPLEHPEGVDECWHVEAAWWMGRSAGHGQGAGALRLRTACFYLASYAGKWMPGESAAHAAREAMQPFVEALDGDSEIPF